MSLEKQNNFNSSAHRWHLNATWIIATSSSHLRVWEQTDPIQLTVSGIIPAVSPRLLTSCLHLSPPLLAPCLHLSLTAADPLSPPL